jgi:hypothetical protein
MHEIEAQGRVRACRQAGKALAKRPEVLPTLS